MDDRSFRLGDHGRYLAKMKQTSMKLNLERNLKQLEDLILEKIRSYDEYENIGPGDDEHPIQLITVGYYIEQSGYAVVVFDTRPNAECDGEWTSYHEDDNMLEVPEWEDAFNHLCDEGTVSVSIPGGKKTLDSNDDNESVAKFFGEQIRDTVLAMKNRNAFDSLPLGDNARVVVEDFNGLWAWPISKKDKKMAAFNDR